MGSAVSSTIKLSQEFPANFAEIRRTKDQVTIQFLAAQEVSLNKHPAQLGQSYSLVGAGSGRGDYSQIRYKTMTIIFLQRAYGFGLRVYDSNAAAKKNFKGLHWFPGSTSYLIQADWHPLKKGKKLSIVDSLDHAEQKDCPGYITFKLNGIENALYPTQDGDELNFMFKDQTNGKETYGAGRYLRSSLPQNGKVLLDFNRSENPPCANSPHGTCPLPPPDNILKTKIFAGEMKPLSK